LTNYIYYNIGNTSLNLKSKDGNLCNMELIIGKNKYPISIGLNDMIPSIR
jgi:hypothetical protein